MTNTKKMRMQDQADGRKDLYMVAPEKLTIEDGWNVRNDNEELQQHIRFLADSIKEIGVQEPLTAYLRKPDNDIVITNGHCRLRAVLLAIEEGAEIKTVPVRCEERTANEVDRTLSMITRNSGKPLTFLEQSIVVKRLIGFGWHEKEISGKTGYTVPHISNMVILSGASPSIQKLVADGQIAATLAVDMVREYGDEQALEILLKAVAKAAEGGKKRATRRNTETGSVRVKWSKVGPEVATRLEVLITCIESGDIGHAEFVTAIRCIYNDMKGDSSE